MTRAEYARRIETWEKWNALSVEAQGNLAGEDGALTDAFRLLSWRVWPRKKSL